jgi:hypothetical protein
VRESSLPVIGGTALLTGALLLTDHTTYSATRSFTDNNPSLRKAAGFMVHLGDGNVHIGVAAAFGLYGFIGSDSRALRVASQTVEALLATGITVQVFKRISGRESPEMASIPSGKWRPFPNLGQYQKHQPRYYSFPSGHIATTAATLTVIAENYPEQTWIRPVGYAILAGVGFGLVNVKYHWYSDLPLGLLLGHTFGMIASHNADGMFTATGTAPQHPRFVVHPAVTPDGGGVGFSLLF